ncbi:GntR family transcriptional regulator [bacterium AH-315-I18]|nr:GntR family transcriptional regulator [bacterium AH-315-I18]
MDIQQTLAEIAPLLKRGSKVPLYQQIRLRVEHGELVAGQSLPTLTQLAGLLHVGQMTVRHTLEELVSQNMRITRQGSGT